jgi:hypothetical protein
MYVMHCPASSAREANTKFVSKTATRILTKPTTTPKICGSLRACFHFHFPAYDACTVLKLHSFSEKELLA